MDLLEKEQLRVIIKQITKDYFKSYGEDAFFVTHEKLLIRSERTAVSVSPFNIKDNKDNFYHVVQEVYELKELPFARLAVHEAMDGNYDYAHELVVVSYLTDAFSETDAAALLACIQCLQGILKWDDVLLCKK